MGPTSEMSVKRAFDPTWKRTMAVGVFLSACGAYFAMSGALTPLDHGLRSSVLNWVGDISGYRDVMGSIDHTASAGFLGILGFLGGLIGAIFASFIAMSVVPVSLIAAAIFAVVFMQCVGLIFTWNGPWTVLGCNILFGGLLTFWYRLSVDRERLLALRVALSGRMERKRIDWIVQNPRVLDAVPSGKVVSIMFLDIVGFSQISERLTPHQAFMDLKSLFDLMRSEVIKYGGMVDKTLGDGMLAYFGYGIDGIESSRAHADAALMCGISIQKGILERNLVSAKEGKAIYPLRIGINTSAVFIGNVGDHDYFDFTVIGNGVNLAKRFEASCQHYSVMIGASTYDLLVAREGLHAKLTRKLIPIKHSEAPYEAYECEPFEDRQSDVRAVTEAFRKSLGIERKDSRWPVPVDVAIYLDSRYGRARLNDFSVSGLSALLPMYIGNGVGLDLVLMIPATLQSPSIGPTLVIHAEVRWGRAVAQGYLHGLMITNLSSQQKDELVDTFRAIIRQGHEADKAAS